MTVPLTACEARDLWDRARTEFPAVPFLRDLIADPAWDTSSGTAGGISIHRDAVPPTVSATFASGSLYPGTVLHEMHHAVEGLTDGALDGYWQARGCPGTWQQQHEIAIAAKSRDGNAPNGMRWPWYLSPNEMFAEGGRLVALAVLGVTDDSWYGNTEERTETFGVPFPDTMGAFYISLWPPTVEERIAKFWRRVDALPNAQYLMAADLGQWARNIIERDPLALIQVADFRSATASMQAALDRAK